MATTTDNYGLIKPGIDDFYDIGVQNDNWDAVDTALEEHAQQLSPSGEKESPADSDSLILTDSTANGIKKRLSWTGVKTALGKVFAGLQHTHSMEEVDALGAALANKMPVDGGVIANINDDIAPGAYTWIDTDNAFGCGTNALFTLTVDAPTYTNYNTPSIVQTITCTYPAENAGLTLKRTSYYATGYTQWVLQATAIKPAVYDLPLAAGWSVYPDHSAEYYKTQEGFVYVTANIWKGENTTIDPGFYTIATLPEGFRPRRDVAWGGGSNDPYIKVFKNGVIEIRVAITSAYFLGGIVLPSA
ncbi:hypothetical protein RWV98_15875 [Agathobaculum sp. NTUH-O15-33]|uniref:hypothetical protein n=1 Tax=Agathobaculum sp. NTUH-O15-33 TaxID=3079302 RepID=UPI0029585481|nr:hypothetical protein [Agathobaculum sp. NTUH-O15-33]WNX84041.1 hypothetical protein RWV98_15875 [Agathobaculum sp. NTUH-O15-33]